MLVGVDTAASPITGPTIDVLFESPPGSGEARPPVTEPGDALALLLSALGPTSPGTTAPGPALNPAVDVAELAVPASRPAALPGFDASIPASLVAIDEVHATQSVAQADAALPWNSPRTISGRRTWH